MNNFDCSSTGTNIELSAFKDTCEGQYLYQEEVQTITGDLVCLNYYYDEYLKDHTITRSQLWHDVFKVEGMNAREFLEYYREYSYSKTLSFDGALKFIDEYYKVSDHINAVLPVNLVSAGVTGYSQGDYSEVIIRVDSEDANMYENLIYGTPCYIVLTVDGEEYSIHSEMINEYDYDKDDVIAICKDTFKLSDYVIEWLDDNLPEYLDYV